MTESKKFNLNQDYCKSFPEAISSGAEILILGSMPGRSSLITKEYYNHSRNIFWRIMSDIIGFDNHKKAYSDKIEILKNRKIALWVVCQSCERRDSLDSNIKKEEPNDIPGLISRHPTIRKIIFNGKKAEKIYDKYFNRNSEIKYLYLPSTSPANTTMKLREKVLKWRDSID